VRTFVLFPSDAMSRFADPPPNLRKRLTDDARANMELTLKSDQPVDVRKARFAEEFVDFQAQNRALREPLKLNIMRQKLPGHRVVVNEDGREEAGAADDDDYDDPYAAIRALDEDRRPPRSIAEVIERLSTSNEHNRTLEREEAAARTRARPSTSSAAGVAGPSSTSTPAREKRLSSWGLASGLTPSPIAHPGSANLQPRVLLDDVLRFPDSPRLVPSAPPLEEDFRDYRTDYANTLARRQQLMNEQAERRQQPAVTAARRYDRYPGDSSGSEEDEANLTIRNQPQTQQQRSQRQTGPPIKLTYSKFGSPDKQHHSGSGNGLRWLTLDSGSGL